MEKKILNARETKNEFINSIYNWLMRTLEMNDKQQYKDCFIIEGQSIICNLPQEYFDNFAIPENSRIEMKFISKKS